MLYLHCVGVGGQCVFPKRPKSLSARNACSVFPCELARLLWAFLRSRCFQQQLHLLTILRTSHLDRCAFGCCYVEANQMLKLSSNHSLSLYLFLYYSYSYSYQYNFASGLHCPLCPHEHHRSLLALSDDRRHTRLFSLGHRYWISKLMKVHCRSDEVDFASTAGKHGRC